MRLLMLSLPSNRKQQQQLLLRTKRVRSPQCLRQQDLNSTKPSLRLSLTLQTQR